LIEERWRDVVVGEREREKRVIDVKICFYVVYAVDSFFYLLINRYFLEVSMVGAVSTYEESLFYEVCYL